MPTPPDPAELPPGTTGRPVAGPGVPAPGGYPGSPVDNRRQLLVKLCWMLLWMVYLAYPIGNLTSGRHGTTATVLGGVGLAVFLGCYIGLVIVRNFGGDRWRLTLWPVVVMLAIAIATSFGLGQEWLTLFAYASVTLGVVLPSRYALGGVVGITALTAAVALAVHADADTLPSVLLPAFLGGAAMTGLQRLVRTMRELREAREAVAHLAAADERLRLARDLHDLLGHSLSLITLKSELAGRFLEQDRYDDARQQVADIERVGRQSLVDVREAVGGYRQPRLAVELAAARTALTAAGVAVEVRGAAVDGLPGLGPDEEGALGWALREAVTNVVRHAEGATRCTVALDADWSDEGHHAVLEVTDNGSGRTARTRTPGIGGHGLAGLGERLALAGGRLETGPAPRGKGFRLRAAVPLRTTAPHPTGPTRP
ncbi:sensor histidine kinase [Streptomyces sp. NPDC092296]|uniref:sensor histidine kinase n=1 Tax=Streptomyces sp. NPDC092296 TaxID=3366012 RepID=UPI0037FCADC7